MSTIHSIDALEILDSRGNPTLEVTTTLDCGAHARFIVPSGASTGIYEALELRDQDSKRYHGYGVLKAVSYAKDIGSKLIGMDASLQQEIDSLLIQMDGTPNKCVLGGNTLLGISMSIAKAHAKSQKKSFFVSLSNTKPFTLPTPLMNVINGGMHADSGLSIQEFMIVPKGFSSFSEKLRCGVEIFHTLKVLLKQKGFSTSVGDEGGFAPSLTYPQAFDFIIQATEMSGYKLGEEVSFALDVAASSFYRDGLYHMNDKDSITQKLTRDDMIIFYKELTQNYPITSIEDPLHEDDYEGFSLLMKEMPHIQWVGDDLFVTNKERLQKGIDMKCANAILIKPNQIGTLSEMIQTINLAKENGMSCIMSHRSGDSEDTTIADLCVGLHLTQIKTGSLCRSERTAKYNQLLRIEKMF